MIDTEPSPEIQSAPPGSEAEPGAAVELAELIVEPAPGVVVEALAQDEEAGRCEAVTRSGEQCKNRAVIGERLCGVHLGRTRRVKGVQGAAAELRSAEELASEDRDEAELGRLRSEVDRLQDVVQQMAPPGYTPPPFSPAALLELLEQNLRRLSPEMRSGILAALTRSVKSDMLDMEMWKGLWTLLNYLLQYQSDLLKRRLHGQYEVDPYGYDPEFAEWLKPLFQFLYYQWWRVDTSGLANVPWAGRGMLVSNHSGALPWDGAMIITAVGEMHPSVRMVRAGIGAWFQTLPFLSVVLQKTGQILAAPENLTRLLEEDELVLVFPEGYKGVGKLFRDRYRLARFGRGGFIRVALKTGSPIIPVAVTGSEEIYPVLFKSDTIARVLGFPYFPFSPFFPWFGLLGFVPLPSKWTIDFGEPIATDTYGPEAADNVALVSQLTEEVRTRIQNMLHERLRRRRSIFLG